MRGRRLLTRIFVFLLLVASAMAAVGLWGWYELYRDGPLIEPRALILPRGSSAVTIAHTLTEQGVIRGPLLFQAVAAIAPHLGIFSATNKPEANKSGGLRRGLQAGEYRFLATQSLWAVLDQMLSAKTVVRRLTMPEGTTSAEQIEALDRMESLAGPLPDEIPPDGSLLPETYFYSWGDQRRDIVNRMRKAMDETMARLWSQRAPNEIVSTPSVAIILASLVERETPLAAERARIASVFINRLRAGMPLQSDPSVIYGLLNGRMALGRPLTRDDLAVPSPYNTYLHKGLPPTPIANPGRAALESVLHPLNTPDLYFVANGMGGHAFAATLEEHNRNVAKWQALQKQQQRERQ